MDNRRSMCTQDGVDRRDWGEEGGLGAQEDDEEHAEDDEEAEDDE